MIWVAKNLYFFNCLLDGAHTMNLQRCFLWSAEIQMIFIDHNHRYLGKEYVVVRSCVFAFVIRRFNIYCVEVKPL